MKRIITLFLGLSLSLLAAPERIVSLSVACDEELLALVPKKRIVALSSPIAEDPELSNVAMEAKAFPKVSGNVEEILALEPDLVLASNWSNPDLLAQLRSFGLPLYVEDSANNLEEVKRNISSLAKVLEEEEAGRRVIAALNEKVSAIKKEIPSGKKPRVLFYSSLGTTAGKDSSFDYLMSELSAINIGRELGLTGHPQFSKEEIIAADPDVIILPIWSQDGSDEKCRRLLLDDPSFASLKAVQEGRFYFLTYRELSPTSQYMWVALEALKNCIYKKEGRK